MNASIQCACTDPDCPACNGACTRSSLMILYRIDMNDQTGTPFCAECADDAFDAGVFTDELIVPEPMSSHLGDSRCVCTDGREHERDTEQCCNSPIE